MGIRAAPQPRPHGSDPLTMTDLSYACEPYSSCSSLINRERRPSMKEVANGLRALDESESPRAISYQSAQGSVRKRINRLLRYSAYLMSVVSSGKRTETVDGGSVQPYRLSVTQEQQASGGRAESLPSVTPPGFPSAAGAAVPAARNLVHNDSCR